MATDTAVVEIDELQGMLVEGQERGFLTAEAIASALEEADLTREQGQDLLSYLEEHGIEVLGAGESELPRRARRSREQARPETTIRYPAMQRILHSPASTSGRRDWKRRGRCARAWGR